MTARSGYLELNSLGATAAGAYVMRRSLMPVTMWPIVPSQPGTLTHVELCMWRTGTPVDFDVIFWRQNTGDPYTFPSTTNNWIIVAQGTVNAASVTADLQSNLQRLKVPVNTPVFINEFERRSDAYNQDYQGAMWGYALTLEQTTLAQSNDSATNVMKCHLGTNTYRSGFQVTYVNTSRNYANNYSNPPGSIMFGLYGHYTVSSVFRDKCLNAQKWEQQGREGDVHLSGINSTESIGAAQAWIVGAHKFTMPGSKVTRALFQAGMRGDRSYQLICNLFTTNANTNHPDTCIGSSHIIDIATLSAPGYNLGQLMNLHFVFSGGVDITSGNNYFFVVYAVNSVKATDTNSYLISLQKGLTGVNSPHRAQILPQTPMAPGNWTIGSAFPLMTYWYVDSETQNIYDTDYPSGSSSGDLSGDQHRAFPGAGNRKFPTFVYREQFRP